ncbi:MAG: hypothetical protein HY662_02110 [Chloroflexi bacterium]|nr:hypothetical protein [Chloroflexota bacterium]
MAGQTIVNFDGLSAEAAEKLAKGFVDVVRVKMESLGKHSLAAASMSLEDVQKAERLFRASAGDGNGGCGIGCW